MTSIMSAGGQARRRPGSRRRLGVATTIAALCLGLLPAQAAATPVVVPDATTPSSNLGAPDPNAWPHYRGGDAAHSAYNSGESTISTANVDALQPIWRGATGANITASPVVANGYVYIGNETDGVYAYSVDCATHGETCLPLWVGHTGGMSFSSPTVANGVVYAAGWDGYLYAFPEGCRTDGGSCTPIWRGNGGGNLGSTPTVAGGIVYVGVTNPHMLLAFAEGCGTGNVVCAPLWTATVGDAIYSSPAVADGMVYVGSNDQNVYAFVADCRTDGGSCSPTWTATTGGTISSSPTVYGGHVYVTSYDGRLNVYAVGCGTSGASCSPAWTGVFSAYTQSSPAIANGVVYVGAGDGQLYAFDAAGVEECAAGLCDPMWTGTMSPGVASGSPAVANGVVYLGSTNGRLYAFDAAGSLGCASNLCKALWTGDAGGVPTSPAVSNGVVYIGSADHYLHAWSITGDWAQFRNSVTRSGANSVEDVVTPDTVQALKPAWLGTAGAAYHGSPVVSDGVVYIGSDDHKLYAFPDGCAIRGGSCSPLWTATTDDAIVSTPAVADGVVYVGSKDNKVYAFAVGCRTDGGACTPIWTGETDADILSSPAVADGKVFIGSDDGKVYAYAVGCSTGGGTCTPVWTGATGYYVRSSPAVSGGMVYAGSDDGKLYVFGEDCNAGGGACLPSWTAELGGAGGPSPAVAGGVVYAAAQGGLIRAFDAAGVTRCSGSPKTCLPIWTADAESSINSSPAVAGGVVYVGADDHYVHAYAVGCGTGGATCTEIWKGLTGGVIRTAPAVAGGLVFVGASDSSLSAFEVGCGTGGATCSPVWSFADTYSSAVEGSPAVANGTVYMSDVDGMMWAFKLEGGTYENRATTYHAISPARVLDSRPTGSGHTNMGLTGTFVAGNVRTFQVTLAHYVGGGTGYAVPATAYAVTGNLTVTGQTAPGVIALAASMTKSGKVTTLNFAVGDNRANNVTLGLAPDGTLSAVLRSSSGSATAHLIFDVTGYFTADDTGATYHALTPGRVLDSRPTGSGHQNIGLSGKFRNKVVRTFNVAGVRALGWPSALVPAGATAVTGNLTVTASTSDGFVAVGPTMSATPSTSTLNVKRGANRANGVTVALRSGRLSAVWVGTAGSTADVIFDVTGYFTADTSGQRFHPIVPVRYLDSVGGIGLSGHFSTGVPRTLMVNTRQVPSGAAGISGNLTVVAPTSNGYGFVAPSIPGTPVSSTLNTNTGIAAANGFDVALDVGSLELIWVGGVGSRADFDLDVTGYWQ